MSHSITVLTAILAAAILLGPAPHAATPPALVNYQGVLRDAADKPLDGDHDMVFRFFTAETGGDEILIDRHTAADSEAVTVTGGLFSVRLGAGAVQDGSGPGTWASLAQVFADLTEVWLRVEVGGEVLDPRVRIVAAAYAINADRLDGRQGSGFIDTTSTPQAKAGRLTIDNATSGQYGLEVYGPEGAYFQDSDQSGQAWIANGNWGVGGRGNVAGGSFEDLDDSGYAHVGIGDYGIKAYGNVAGGSFEDLDNTSSTQVGFAGFGVYAFGNDAGGYFNDSNQSGYAFVGYGDYGIQAYGDFAAGSFENTLGGSVAYAGRENYGIRASGNSAGGTFGDLDDSGYAYVGYGDRGIHATGYEMGGYFADANSPGLARIGYGAKGIHAEGSPAGHFQDSATAAYAYVANGDGLTAYGDNGAMAGDLNTGAWVLLGSGDNSTLGNGSKNFIQNHPYDRDRVIAYTSLEGDEVGTYTRGTARLVNGEVRVSLGETFQWVTNPDVGLTVHLTPVGEWSELYVAERSTREIVVRSRGGDGNATFDYVVFGLRIGFEESAPVREKTVESFIPSMTEQRELYEKRPELRGYTALARFKAMAVAVDGTADIDLSGAAELRAAIQEYDPRVHGPMDQLLGHGPPRRDLETGEASPSELNETGIVHAELVPDVPAPSRSPIDGVTVPRATDGQAPQDRVPADELRGDPLPVSKPVETGQVLAFDPEHPGEVRAANTMADPRVIGVAIGMADDTLEVRVAAIGFVECRVDAGYGAIQAGDLLTSSPTPGHAMRAMDVQPGTILGKALEPLEVGTGTIQILVNPR